MACASTNAGAFPQLAGNIFNLIVAFAAPGKPLWQAVEKSFSVFSVPS